MSPTASLSSPSPSQVSLEPSDFPFPSELPHHSSLPLRALVSGPLHVVSLETTSSSKVAAAHGHLPPRQCYFIAMAASSTALILKSKLILFMCLLKFSTLQCEFFEARDSCFFSTYNSTWYTVGLSDSFLIEMP